MAEFLEEFASDPSWTNELGSYTHDATNEELDINTLSAGGRYYWRSDDVPGGMEQECQGTFFSYSGNGSGFTGPVAVRGHASASAHYELQHETGAGAGGNVYWVAINDSGGGRTVATWSNDIDINEFYTHRLACEGGDGANVAGSFWIASHGGTKPSLQDWIGDDGSPDDTGTDTNAARLDDVTTDLNGGAGGSTRNYDIRLDYHRMRLISDRGGAPVGLFAGSLALLGVGI